MRTITKFLRNLTTFCLPKVQFDYNLSNQLKLHMMILKQSSLLLAKMGIQA